MLDKTLDSLRFILIGVVLFLGVLLYQAWEQDFAPKTVAAAAKTNAQPASDHFAPTIPSVNQTAESTTAVVANTQVATGALVTVKTDVLDLVIDTRGGDIVTSQLLDYPESLGATTPFLLMNNDPSTRYIAESGLLSDVGPDTSSEQALYTAEKANYSLENGQDTLTVKLTWQKNGLDVAKIFTFKRGSYEINVAYDVLNQSGKPQVFHQYNQLMRTNTPPVNHGGFVNLTTYFGAAISSQDKPFEKIAFKNMQEQPLNKTIKDGWAAMIQHYFISAWIPAQGMEANYYSKVNGNGLYTIGMIGPEMTLQPGAKQTVQSKLYTGPAIADLLEKTAPHLKLTIDYGWFWFISDIIFWMMKKIHDVIGNWGWSIVMVTIIIKALFYQLSAKSYRSMSVLKKLQPKMEALKEKYKDDRQKLTQATMDLYRTEKVNPMSGCLPILVQIPVFIALYWVIVESVQLRQAPFMFWIHDLSVADPYYVLPVMMGISMFIQQRLNPPPPDPMQARIMMMMPIVFTVMFAKFPAGLMLYWFVNNTLSFMQQWYVMRQVNGK